MRGVLQEADAWGISPMLLWEKAHTVAARMGLSFMAAPGVIAKYLLLIQLRRYCDSQRFLHDKVAFVHTQSAEAV